MKFSEIYGQDNIKKKLIVSVKENRVSHAQLLTGDEGVGKLQLAIAYAQFINCTDRQENDSCGVCPSCLKIEKHVHPDIHYIFPVIKTDSKEKTSFDYIEQWRELCLDAKFFSYSSWLHKINAENKQGLITTAEVESFSKKLNLKSYESDYKIFIIWQADKMHNSFANKILKALEEPPNKTCIILITEKPNQIIPTILSRTQIIKIPRLDNETLANGLTEILNVDNEKALELAKISDGSFLHAFELFNNNEALLFNKDAFVRFMRICWSEKPLEINEFVDEMQRKGRETQKSFLVYALRMIRENFIYNIGEYKINLMTNDELDFSKKFAKYINSRNVNMIAEEINKANYHIERNGNARIIFFDLSLKLGKLLKM